MWTIICRLLYSVHNSEMAYCTVPHSHIYHYCSSLVKYKTSAVLRLKCSIDCISGSVGHHTIFSVHFLTVSVSFEEEQISKKCNYKNVIGSVGHHQCYINWSSGPIPIVHTNFQDNPLTTLGISRHFKMI